MKNNDYAPYNLSYLKIITEKGHGKTHQYVHSETLDSECICNSFLIVIYSSLYALREFLQLLC